MKKKLTLQIRDETVIDLAKNYAQSQGQSLSNLVENYLFSLVQNEKIKSLKKHRESKPELKKLKGSLKDIPFKSDDKDPIYDSFMEKYS